MEQWRDAFDAYQLGRLKEASQLTHDAVKVTDPSSLLSAAHLTNLAALSGQRASSPPLPDLPSGLTPEYLFRTEIYLTRIYNAALATARKESIRAANALLRKSSHVFDSLALPSPTILVTHGALSLPQDTPLNFVKRVCSAYSAVLQLRAALMLNGSDDNDRNPVGAFEISSQAKTWQHVALSLHVVSQQSTETADRSLARAASLLSLTKAVSGDYSGAIHEIAPYAELSEDQRETQPIWSAVYQHAALRALQSLRNSETDTDKPTETDEKAISQLEAVARAGYRSSDAHSLVARLHRESQRALLSFQSALALQHDRPATLVAAAAAFGKEGDHEAETELLACATELRNASGSKFDVVLVKPWKPSRITVDLMKAKSLLLNGNPAGALKVLAAVEDVPKFMKEKARIELAAVAQLGENGNANDNTRLLKKTADKYRVLGCRSAGVELASADARLCAGDVAGAREILDKLTGTVVDGSDELLRGICYNNSGVLDMCASGSVAHGDHENFAAAQVAFAKCDGAWAQEAADAATWNRTLALAEAGRLEEGASHWTGRRKGKRGLIPTEKTSTQFTNTKHHVMGRVCEEDKAAMDEICRKIEESVKMQKELEKVMKDTDGQW